MTKSNVYEPVDLPIIAGESKYDSIADFYEYFCVSLPAKAIFMTKEEYEYASQYDFQGVYRFKKVKPQGNRYCDFVYVENEIINYDKDYLTFAPVKIQDDFFLKYMDLADGDLPEDEFYFHEYMPYNPEHYKTGEQDIINIFGNLVGHLSDYYVVGQDGNKYEVLNEVHDDGFDITSDILDKDLKTEPKLMELMEKDNYQGVFQAFCYFCNGYLFEERFKVRLEDDGLYYFDEMENQNYIANYFLMWVEDDDGYPKQLCNVYKIAYIPSKFITE